MTHGAEDKGSAASHSAAFSPMIANGKVYVATTNGVGVFGLLP
jgi:hypothetical protein